jgi:hypothetical protein
MKVMLGKLQQGEHALRCERWCPGSGVAEGQAGGERSGGDGSAPASHGLGSG